MTMRQTIRFLATAFALVASVLADGVSAAELKVLSAGAMRAVLQELAPAFETASGHKLKIEYATAGVVEQKVAEGDPRFKGEVAQGGGRLHVTLDKLFPPGPG